MRIAFWISALLALSSCTAEQSPGPSTVTARTANAQTEIEIRTGGVRRVLDVARDDTVPPDAQPARTDIVGEIPKVAIVVADTYPSVPGGMSLCQAGEERFLRVISLTKNEPEETLRLKLASCRENVELSSPGVQWAQDSGTVSINWLAGPGGDAETRSIRIGPDGKPIPAH
jgi:hypothetical protein